MNDELNKSAIEVYSIYVADYHNAKDDQTRFEIFQMMINMRKRFPKESGYWENNYGPSF